MVHALAFSIPTAPIIWALIEQRLADLSSSVNPSVRWQQRTKLRSTPVHYRAIVAPYLPLETRFGGHPTFRIHLTQWVQGGAYESRLGFPGSMRLCGTRPR
jgi:hypothetical protein